MKKIIIYLGIFTTVSILLSLTICHLLRLQLNDFSLAPIIWLAIASTYSFIGDIRKNRKLMRQNIFIVTAIICSCIFMILSLISAYGTMSIYPPMIAGIVASTLLFTSLANLESKKQ